MPLKTGQPWSVVSVSIDKSCRLGWGRYYAPISQYLCVYKTLSGQTYYLRPSPGGKRLLALSHLRHYAKQALTPWSLNVKLGLRRIYHKGRAAIRHYANQTARPLRPLRRRPNFTYSYSGVNARLA